MPYVYAEERARLDKATRRCGRYDAWNVVPVFILLTAQALRKTANFAFYQREEGTLICFLRMA